MAREMKDSGIQWVGIIPADWECRRLRFLCEIQTGNQDTQDSIPDGLFPFYVRSPIVERSNKYTFEGPAILMAGDGAGAGRVFHYVDGKYGCHQRVYSLQKITDINRRFLYYYLSNLFYREIEIANSKSTVDSVRLPMLQNFQVVFPNDHKQKKIVEHLDSKCAEIDAVLNKTRTSIEEYKKLKQAIITQAVTKGIRGDKPMKESGVEWVPLIPEGWSSYRGKHLFYETNERSETGSEELLTVSHKTGITPRSQKNVNMFMSESLVGYKICREGDIAANTMWMWQGAIGVSAYYGVISPSYNTYRQRNGAFDPQYLDYLLRIPPLVDQYNVCSTGITASRLRLYPEQFLSLRFIVPPMEEQQEIVMFLRSRVNDIDVLIQKKEQFLAELETYKKSLIYEYVTGKKEV